MNDCGGCKFCLDKRKFGGPGKLKKRCELRVCMTPRRMGAPSPKPMVHSSPMVNSGPKLPLEVRNKFLTTIENRQNIKIIENPPMPAENRVALENIIEMGLETYEVVNVVPNSQHMSTNNPVRVLATSGQPQQLCYICKRDNKEDLFYCSSCGDNFHQFCLQLQNPGSVQTVSTTCGRCQNTKQGSYEQAMNARAESIPAKCEEIYGAQYQVISFLTDPDSRLPEMILQVEDPSEQQEEEEVSSQQQTEEGQQQQIGGNKLYDNDFNSYLQIPEISLASE